MRACVCVRGYAHICAYKVFLYINLLLGLRVLDIRVFLIDAYDQYSISDKNQDFEY